MAGKRLRWGLQFGLRSLLATMLLAAFFGLGWRACLWHQQATEAPLVHVPDGGRLLLGSQRYQPPPLMIMVTPRMVIQEEEERLLGIDQTSVDPTFLDPTEESAASRDASRASARPGKQPD